jgi:hypothetical protein
MSPDERRRDDIPQVIEDENGLLVESFTEEVKRAVFQMEHNKVTGPDCFPAEFYQVFLGADKRGPDGSIS